MNLIIDVGNTQYKICIYDNNKMVYHNYFEEINSSLFSQLFNEHNITKAIFSDTRGVSRNDILDLFPNDIPLIELSYKLKLPIKIDYDTPETLGKDRIAGAVGAIHYFQNSPALIIDIGTAITIDFIDENSVFQGGIISPGPEIRFASLHNFTGNLPLISPSKDLNLIGKTTKKAIQCGVQNGILHEINGYIDYYTDHYNDLKIILTGGHAYLFDKKIKYRIFAKPFLIPEGLNRILNYNE